MSRRRKTALSPDAGHPGTEQFQTASAASMDAYMEIQPSVFATELSRMMAAKMGHR